MEWITVISLILVGLTLIVVEIIFIPGTTVVGFIGFGLLIFGLVLSFNYFDSSIGWIMVGSTAVASGLIFYWAFRSNPWERFSLKNSIQSKVNEGDLDGLKIGEEGMTVSALRPMGKADLHGKMVEVTTQGNYVDSHTRIRIVRILFNQILVEPIN